MNGYCQAGLEEAIGRRRGAWGGDGTVVGFLVGLLFTFLFLGKKMEWEVPEVMTGSDEMDTGVGSSCLVPSSRMGDAETSTLCFPHNHMPGLGDERRVTAAAVDAVNCR